MDTSTFITLITAVAALAGAMSPIIVAIMQSKKDEPENSKGILLPDGVTIHSPKPRIRWEIVLLFAVLSGFVGYSVAKLASTNSLIETPTITPSPTPVLTPTSILIPIPTFTPIPWPTQTATRTPSPTLPASPTDMPSPASTASVVSEGTLGIKVTFELGTTEDYSLWVDITTEEGVTVASIEIAPGTSQTIILPPGSYIYKVKRTIPPLSGAAGECTILPSGRITIQGQDKIAVPLKVDDEGCRNNQPICPSTFIPALLLLVVALVNKGVLCLGRHC